MEMTQLYDIYAYVQPVGLSHIYGCGIDSTASQVGYFRMENTNSFKFFKMFNANSNDECRGLVYDASTSQITLLIYSQSSNLKTYATSNYDVFLLIVSDSGVAQRGVQISLSS